MTEDDNDWEVWICTNMYRVSGGGGDPMIIIHPGETVRATPGPLPLMLGDAKLHAHYKLEYKWREIWYEIWIDDDKLNGYFRKFA